MLKILQGRLQQYVNPEIPDIQARFRKGKGTREQIANICWSIGKAREFQKNICLFFVDYAKDFDCVDHNKQWKILQEMGYQTTLLASPGEGNGNPLQYSCLENAIDGGTWWVTVHGVAKSQTRL